MTELEFRRSVQMLGLQQVDLAARFGVNSRTVRRWWAGAQPIPAWVTEVLSAWRQLHERQLPWGADLESIWYGDDDQIRRHQSHDKALAALLKRVRARGGACTPWYINLRERRASLGKITVRFYKLKSGSFSLASYRRGDMLPDVGRDWQLIEDAVAAFAEAVSAARAARPKKAWDE